LAAKIYILLSHRGGKKKKRWEVMPTVFRSLKGGRQSRLAKKSAMRATI